MSIARNLHQPDEAEFNWPNIPRHVLSPSSDTPVYLETSGDEDEMIVLTYGGDDEEPEGMIVLNGHEAAELRHKIGVWIDRRELLHDPEDK